MTQENPNSIAADPSPPGESNVAAADELIKLQAENAQIKDKWLRMLAEHENFKRRKSEELPQLLERREENLLLQFLPVLDNLEKARQQLPDASDLQAFKSGLELTEKLFRQALEKFDVYRIDSLGTAFDPSKHQAIAQESRAGVQEGTVIQEVTPGYRRGQRALRAALVIVAS